MRGFGAAFLAISLLVSTSGYAADTSALAPGKPAGVARAQSSGLETAALVTVGAVVVVGFALLTARTSALPTTVIASGTSNSFTTTTTP